MSVLLIVTASLLILVLLSSYILYRRFFYTPVKHQNDIDHLNKFYAYAARIKDMTEHMVSLPAEMVYITSSDGLKLEGRYYPSSSPDAPTAVLLHGYRGVSLIDMAGGAPLLMEMGFNVLLVSHRGCMGSEGHTVTFGVKETGDALRWVKYVRERNGSDTPIYLMGISMGAHTVLNTADKMESANVRGIIADCPYTSSRGIINSCLKRSHLSPRLLTWFVNLTTSLWGGFRLSPEGAVEAVRKSSVPVLLIHGKADKLVPFSMSEEIRDAAPERVSLIPFDGAVHAESYLSDTEKYRKAVRDFVASTR